MHMHFDILKPDEESLFWIISVQHIHYQASKMFKLGFSEHKIHVFELHILNFFLR